ncbi:MAG: hypothetical protein ISS15_07545 [Alphaproteobacteria bacterium]|nr:hypothetical protein [Alphaproteobacteria bacterium]MBL7097494.1 hypothetical protein [Alphaproteobacteria bacterium]
MAHQRAFAPRIIASHADYRRSDFIFSRTQSREMRNAQWEDRIRPMRTWSEIGGYAGMTTLALMLTAFIF